MNVHKCQLMLKRYKPSNQHVSIFYDTQSFNMVFMYLHCPLYTCFVVFHNIGHGMLIQCFITLCAIFVQASFHKFVLITSDYYYHFLGFVYSTFTAQCRYSFVVCLTSILSSTPNNILHLLFHKKKSKTLIQNLSLTKENSIDHT